MGREGQRYSEGEGEGEGDGLIICPRDASTTGDPTAEPARRRTWQEGIVVEICARRKRRVNGDSGQEKTKDLGRLKGRGMR